MNASRLSIQEETTLETVAQMELPSSRVLSGETDRMGPLVLTSALIASLFQMKNRSIVYQRYVHL